MNGQNVFNFNVFLQVFLDFLVPLISCLPGHPKPQSEGRDWARLDSTLLCRQRPWWHRLIFLLMKLLLVLTNSLFLRALC